MKKFALILFGCATISTMQARLVVENDTELELWFKVANFPRPSKRKMTGTSSNFHNFMPHSSIKFERPYRGIPKTLSVGSPTGSLKPTYFEIPDAEYRVLLRSHKHTVRASITFDQATKKLTINIPPTVETLWDQLGIVPKSVKEETKTEIAGKERERLDKELKTVAQEEGKQEEEYVKIPATKGIRDITADYLITEEDPDYAD